MRLSLVFFIGAACMFAAASCVSSARKPTADAGAVLPPWKPGDLDIHHINTGRGNAAFFIFPDGTTMLIDAGDLDAQGFEKRNSVLKLAPRRPDETVTPGSAIADYIRKAAPAGRPARLDYALITHFHDDHYGAIRPGLRRNEPDGYFLTGITEVGDQIPIGALIDRASPSYQHPVDLQKHFGATFENYLRFQKRQGETTGMETATLAPGRSDQIVLKHDPDNRYSGFSVENIKANEWLALPDGSLQVLFDPEDLYRSDGWLDENPLSLAVKVNYGDFDYFSGGDIQGLRFSGRAPWLDVETPLSRTVGEVDALSLNHHGNRDAVNETFLGALSPQIVVQQSWVSDQPGQEVVHRLASKDLLPDLRGAFSTFIAEETITAYGTIVDSIYRSYGGHIVIRVSEDGRTFRVFVLDDQNFSLTIKDVYGPYASKP